MPPLYNFDDYDRCLQEFNRFATYCFVRADVIPQTNSEAWQAIEEISQYYKHHYNHRHLYYGICVEQCESQIEALLANETDALFNGILMNNTKVRQLFQRVGVYIGLINLNRIILGFCI